MLAEREHDYFAETVICANCYIVAFNKAVADMVSDRFSTLFFQ